MSGSESLTVAEVKQKQRALEAHIEKALNHFEEITGLEILEVVFDRDRTLGEDRDPVVRTSAVVRLPA